MRFQTSTECFSNGFWAESLSGKWLQAQSGFCRLSPPGYELNRVAEKFSSVQVPYQGSIEARATST